MAGNSSVLLLRGNDFIDEIGKTITNNGVTISNAVGNPFGAGNAMYFNGSSSLNLATNTDFFVGTGDFTIELWFYPLQQTSLYPQIFSAYSGPGSGASEWQFGYNNNAFGGTSSFKLFTENPVLTSTVTLTQNAWNHVCVSKNYSGIYFFINGKFAGYVAYSSSIDFSSGGLRIGGGNRDGINSYIKGYISDLHVIKGYAKYLSNITIPSSELSITSSGAQSLLMHFPSTNTYIDVNGKTATPTNMTQTSVVYKFGNSSVYFNGTNSKMEIPYSSDFDFGTGDFTIEYFYMPSNLTAAQVVLDTRNFGQVATEGKLIIYHNATTGALVIQGGTAIDAQGGSLNVNYLNHVVVCKKNGYTAGYINGKFVCGFIDNHNYSCSTVNGLMIGQNRQALNANVCIGYLDELNIIKGYSKYPTYFTVPSDYVSKYTSLSSKGIVRSLKLNNSITDDTGAIWVNNNNSVTYETYASVDNEYSGYFNGLSETYLTTSGSDLNFGTEDFCIDLKLLPYGDLPNNSGSHNNIIFDFRPYQVNGMYPCMYWSSTDGKIRIYLNSADLIITTVAMSTQNWFHIQFIRYNGTYYLIQNGVVVGSTTTNGTANLLCADTMAIGNDQSFGNGLNPYNLAALVKDFTITKGVTKGFSAYTDIKDNIPGQVLGLHFDDFTSEFNIVKDSSSNNLVVSPYYTVFSKSVKKFGNQSCLFNGYNSRLSNTTIGNYVNSNVNTIELFYYSFGGLSNTGYGYFTNRLFTVGGYDVGLYSTTNKDTPLGYYFLVNGDYSRVTYVPCTINKKQMYHLAVVGNANTVKFYHDGVQVYSGTGTAGFSTGILPGTTLNIGNMTALTSPFYGYIDSFRVSNNNRYTSNFTVPTSEFVNDANTSILLLFETVGINNIAADKAINNTNVVVSSTKSKFGNTSAYFNGTSFLTIPNTTDFDFGTGDFTIDAWVNFTNNATALEMITDLSSANSSGRVSFYRRADGKIALARSGVVEVLSGSTIITQNNWYHLAVSRKSGVSYIFVNGNIDGTISDSNSYTLSVGGGTAYIGGANGGSNIYLLNGYIDDLRITKGICLYDSNFTVPTTYFNNRSDIKYGIYNKSNGIGNITTTQIGLSPLALYSMADYYQTSYLSNKDGKVLLDSSGNNNNASIYGDIKETSFLGIPCLHFSGSNCYIESPSISYLNNPTNGYTIEFFYCPNAVNSQMNIVSLGYAKSLASTNGIISVMKSDTVDQYSSISHYYKNGSVAQTTLNSLRNCVSLDGWKHIIVTHDSSGNRKIYSNGMITGNGNIALPTLDTSRDRIIIGSDQLGANRFTGFLSSVAVYGKALTSSEVNSIFLAYLQQGSIIYNASLSENSIITSTLSVTQQALNQIYGSLTELVNIYTTINTNSVTNMYLNENTNVYTNVNTNNRSNIYVTENTQIDTITSVIQQTLNQIIGYINENSIITDVLDIKKCLIGLLSESVTINMSSSELQRTLNQIFATITDYVNAYSSFSNNNQHEIYFSDSSTHSSSFDYLQRTLTRTYFDLIENITITQLSSITQRLFSSYSTNTNSSELYKEDQGVNIYDNVNIIEDFVPQQLMYYDFNENSSIELSIVAGILKYAYQVENVISEEFYDKSLRYIQNLIDQINVSDSFSSNNLYLVSLFDRTSIDDNIDVNQLLNVIINENVLTSVKININGYEVIGYVANGRTGSTSLYDNFSFNSFTKINNKYYGCSDSGVYSLFDSDNDDGQSIKSSITSGLMDLHTNRLKSFSDAYIVAKNDGSLYIRCIVDGKEYTYKFNNDSSKEFEVNRANIGRGLQSAVWQFELVNDGGDFDLESVKLYPLILSRTMR